MKEGERSFLVHEGKKLKEVMRDVFENYPEESFYFLNEGKLKKNAEIFQEEFLSGDSRRRMAYAVKANPGSEVLRILNGVGITEFDCASEGEIESVERASPGSEMFFNNPHKKSREIRSAKDAGVRHYTADMQSEVDKILSEVGDISPEIAIRLKTLNAEGARINLSEKFGTSDEQAQKLLKYVEERGAIPCVSMNVGSQVIDVGSYERGLVRMIQTVRESVGRVGAINLGGGMPVSLEHSGVDNELLLREYLGALSCFLRESVNEVLRDDDEAKIIIEPGRSMVASAVDLAVGIVNVREGQRALTIDDGIFTSFSDSTIHNWRYRMDAVDQDGKEITNEKQDFSLYGRSCDSGDVIHGQSLPTGLTDRDYIHVPNAGAYLSSQASEFNGYPVHRYVVYNS